MESLVMLLSFFPVGNASGKLALSQGESTACASVGLALSF